MRRRRQKQTSISFFLTELLESRLLLSALPAGWSDNDVGSPPLTGSGNYNLTANTYSVAGSGTGVGGASDQLNFANYAMTGDGSITALITSLTNTNPAAKAGVMIRASTAAGSLFATVDETAQNTVAFEWRSGSTASISSTVTITGPVWLRVNDQGNNFTGYYSTDNVTWTQIGSTQPIAMPSAMVLSGPWASSNNNSALNTAQFSDVSLMRGGWTDSDIGAPTMGGAAIYDAPSDTTTIFGNGADIFGNSDQFNFASTTMTGDGSAIAYVNSISNTDAWAKAGVMIRNDSSATSAFAALVVSPTSGIAFEWRATAGDVTNQEISSPAGGPTPAPVGLKLTRAGNTFNAYYSTDGINWLLVGPSQTATIANMALAGLAVTSHNPASLCMAAFSSVSIGSQPPPGAGIYSTSDQLFLNDLENRELLAFYNETNPTTGLVPDNVNANGGSPSPDSSIAAIGFALSALTIGDARGWLTHANAYQRALNTITFLYTNGANNNGFFYHFLNETTGARYGTSEVSSVDTAELMSGVLNAAQYWPGTALQTTALTMFDRVNWPWMQQSNGIFYGAWTPESGFSGGYGDYSEASLLYLLSLGSPTHPTSQASWLAWSRTPVRTYSSSSSSFTYVTADDGALFTVQYPMAWFNLQGLVDSKGLNYYQNAQTATLAQRQWMIDLSSSFSDYGPNLWGLTPAEGGAPSYAQGANTYTIWGGPPANVPVDGTVVPTAAGGSLEFNPRLSINALENMKQTYGSTVYQAYGLVDAFNPLKNWTSTLVLGIDIGMTLLAAENSRSNLVWNVFDQNLVARQALAKAFTSSSKPTWLPNTSGNWNAGSSWANGVIPNAAGAEADFFGAIGANQSVYSDVAVTAGTLNFNNPNTYAIDGVGSLTLQATSGSAQVIVQQGTQKINLPTTIASNTVFNVATGATLIIADPLTINAGMTLSQTGGGTVIFQSLINLLAGASVVFGNTTIPSAREISLSSSAPAGDPNYLTTVAAIQNVNGGGGVLYTSFGGAAGLTNADVLLKDTYYGDANLDGTVDSADYSLIDKGFSLHLTGWNNGDLNYDGIIDGSDYTLIDNTFNALSAQPVTARR